MFPRSARGNPAADRGASASRRSADYGEARFTSDAHRSRERALGQFNMAHVRGVAVEKSPIGNRAKSQESA
jgi:hypothetical protein